MKRLIFILLLSMFLTSIVKAQQGNFVEKSGSSSITASINLEITSGSITISPFNTESDIEIGLETSAVRFVIKSNKDWKLATEIGLITAIPLASGDGPANITSPLSYTNIEYSTTSTDNDLYNNVVSFQSSIANIKTGVKGNIGKIGNTFNLKFRITPGYEVDPAKYTIPIIYTISAQ